MATIRLCDWTKKRLGKNDQTHTLVLGGNEYEISDEALREIKSRLDGEMAPVGKPVVAPPPRPVAPQPEDDLGVNVEAPSPFGGKAEAGLLDDTPAQPVPSAPPIAIPASTKERLPAPTVAQTDAVLAESKRFQEGTLKTLTPGKHRNQAAKKLADKEATFDDNSRQVPDIRGRRGE